MTPGSLVLPTAKDERHAPPYDGEYGQRGDGRHPCPGSLWLAVPIAGGKESAEHEKRRCEVVRDRPGFFRHGSFVITKRLSPITFDGRTDLADRGRVCRLRNHPSTPPVRDRQEPRVFC